MTGPGSLPASLADLAPPGTVAVRLVDLAAAGAGGPADRAVLDAAEIERAGRFAFPHLTRRFVARRAALRHCLGRRLGLPPDAVAFVVGPKDKPAVDPACLGAADPAAARLRFNLSDTDDVAAIAVCLDAPVGVDIEVPRQPTEPAGLARRVMTPEEHADWLALPDDAARHRAFFTLWTRKEAVMKALGAGLSLAPGRFATGFAPLRGDAVAVPPDALPDGLAVSGAPVRLADLALPADLPGAVALVGPPPRPVVTADATIPRSSGI